ncbi:MAG: AAA family ATPase [Deltaproteobacteria bacterium]|nr:AAA family ATPase [Deltaproteobacteria bacterium]
MARKQNGKSNQNLDEKVVSLQQAAERREADAARAAVTRVLESEGLTQKAIAREVGVNQSAISSWLKSTYKGDNTAVTAKVARWLEHRAQAAETTAKLPEGPFYIETPTAERIITALSYGQTMQDLVLAYGAAGVGKTVAAIRYARTRPNVWLVTITPASRSVYGTLHEVAEAVGLRGVAGSSSRLHREIVQRLKDTKGLLIVDEAQHLSVQALETLRAIHDGAEIGLALVGNEIVYGRLTGGDRSVGFAQLFSRIGKRLKFSRPKTNDVAALAEAWNIKDPKAVAQLQEIAQRPGALRAVSKTVRLALMLSMGVGQKQVSAAHLEAAWKELGGATTWA